ncbi:Wzz/FepE/Etk N-terminal domain-containing protein [Rhodoferax aquaticus]|uniref:Polysaccharide chain length determinant N-terminal domain-containing protein n=1 Tax=Rhodoferax aquaticus TaxID=2527691 RepID=A0A515EL54_9BURK|nr:Wzz/FepE/Etk N-terminal domain-containing protein [Rhodoferax aquaticus]QDL53398.1 hypothetical protein EXZ61_03960 [Rhodoferax aquaticus]
MNQEFPVSGLSFSQLLAILLARKRTLFTCVVIAVVATLVLSLSQTKTYVASAEIFIDFRSSDPLTGRLFNSAQDETYLQTQVDIMQSEEVLSQMISATGMLSGETMKKRIAAQGEAKAHSLLLVSMQKSLDVAVRKASRVVELKLALDDPEQARDALNAGLKAYMDLVQRISVAPAKSRQEQYSAQLETLRLEQDKIQASITDYQQKNGILETDERLDLGNRQLNELSTRQAALQSLRLDAQSKNQAVLNMLKAGAKAADIPEIASQRGIPDLRLRLADLDRQAADLGGVYGKNHPRFKSILAERETMSQRIDREAQLALDAFLQESKRYDSQARALAGDVNAQQQSMLSMKKHRDVLASYQRQLDSVQKIYNSAIQKYDELLIASTVNTPSLTVLRWASAPITHSKPNLRLNLVLSVPVGLLVGLGLVFLTEVARRRVRHIDDLARDPAFVVLGRNAEQAF